MDSKIRQITPPNHPLTQDIPSVSKSTDRFRILLFIVIGLIATSGLLITYIQIHKFQFEKQKNNTYTTNIPSSKDSATNTVNIVPVPSENIDNLPVISTKSIPINSTYTLVRYPISESPVKTPKDICTPYSPFYEAEYDYRLIKDDKAIITPSLIKLISEANSKPIDCTLNIDIFSIPSSDNFLYLKTGVSFGNDAPYSGFDYIYRLNLSDLTLYKLLVSNFVRSFDLYRGDASESFRLLPDGKRLIKWNMNGVYLVNLEKDTKIPIYQVEQNQWLISNITFSMGQTASYDIQIENDEINIGIYDKTITDDGNTIIVDKYDNVSVADQRDNINPKFLKKESLQILQ